MFIEKWEFDEECFKNSNLQTLWDTKYNIP